jgi:RNA polymerase-binding transcription factor DksA
MRDPSTNKARLEARLSELEKRLHRIGDRLDDPVSKDWEDQAVEREDDEVLEDLGRAGLKEIEVIRAALDRISEGTYGVCARCGEDISEDRLDAIPHTPLCRTCAQGV